MSSTPENVPHQGNHRRKKTKNNIDIKNIVIILLTICLFASLCLSLWLWLKGTSIVIPANVTNTSSNDATPSEPERETIDMEEFKAYAAKYSVSMEFLQRFFDDIIVYKNKDGIQYMPIDDTLPKNTYDFKNNLVYTDREIKYQGEVESIRGIDVSNYQGNIDWKKVAADGVDYAFIRVGVRGYGTGAIVEDKMWRRNIEGALAAGIDVGAYFYSQAITVEEAIEEAEFVLDCIKGYDITYPVVYDFEEVDDEASRTLNLTAAQRTDFTIAFCEKVKSAGYKPMVYGNIKWMVEMLDLSRLTQYDKWFAQYFKTPFFPYDMQIWQYSGSGVVDGVEGPCDLNISFKDYNPDPNDSGENNSTESDSSSSSSDSSDSTSP